jgi:hypothetical protein
MSDYDMQRLAELIAALPPAPEAWVEAAAVLPFARVDEIVERAEADDQFRKALLADLESALEAAGYEPQPSHILEALRDRFTGQD